MATQPFTKALSTLAFQEHLESIRRDIDSLENSYVLRTSQSELESYYIKKAWINPLEPSYAEVSIEDENSVNLKLGNGFNRMFPGENATVRGTEIVISIPYKGDMSLWNLRPSTYSITNYPDIEIATNQISFSIRFTDANATTSNIKKQIDDWVNVLQTSTDILLQDVARHNEIVPTSVKAWIAEKKLKATNVSGVIANLGIPIKQRNNPATYSVPLQKKSVAISMPRASTESYKPEPAIDSSTYDEIIETLQSMSLTIEQSPSAFSEMDEEGIRTLFLVSLNSKFTGGASGETFNKSGKTDILVVVDERRAFIAECKFWKGEKSFNDAIDQLLSYLTWRDCKCALLIFNKNKNTLAVANTMHETMKLRKEHIRTVSHSVDKPSHYIFVKTDDPGREIRIATLVFDIPK